MYPTVPPYFDPYQNGPRFLGREQSNPYGNEPRDAFNFRLSRPQFPQEKLNPVYEEDLRFSKRPSRYLGEPPFNYTGGRLSQSQDRHRYSRPPTLENDRFKPQITPTCHFEAQKNFFPSQKDELRYSNGRYSDNPNMYNMSQRPPLEKYPHQFNIPNYDFQNFSKYPEPGAVNGFMNKPNNYHLPPYGENPMPGYRMGLQNPYGQNHFSPRAPFFLPFEDQMRDPKPRQPFGYFTQNYGQPYSQAPPPNYGPPPFERGPFQGRPFVPQQFDRQQPNPFSRGPMGPYEGNRNIRPQFQRPQRNYPYQPMGPEMYDRQFVPERDPFSYAPRTLGGMGWPRGNYMR